MHLRFPICVRKILGKKLDPNSIIGTGTELDSNSIIKTGSEMDPNKTAPELDNNLILQYLVLDEVHSVSFGSNFNQIIQLQ